MSLVMIKTRGNWTTFVSERHPPKDKLFTRIVTDKDYLCGIIILYNLCWLEIEWDAIWSFKVAFINESVWLRSGSVVVSFAPFRPNSTSILYKSVMCQARIIPRISRLFHCLSSDRDGFRGIITFWIIIATVKYRSRSYLRSRSYRSGGTTQQTTGPHSKLM